MYGNRELNNVWHDSMEFETIIGQGFEEEDDMNEEDAAVMRGYLDNDKSNRNEFERKQLPQLAFAQQEGEI